MDKIGLKCIKKGSNDQTIIYVHGFNFNESDKKRFLEDDEDALRRLRLKGSVYALTWKSGSKISPLIRAFLLTLGLLSKSPKTFIPAMLLSFIIQKLVLNHFDYERAKKRADSYYPKKIFNYIEKHLGTGLNNKKVFLIGHSLGTLIIFEALQYISKYKKNINLHIEDIFFLGSAINSSEKKFEQDLTDTFRGKLFNFYSKKDLVLKYLRWGGAWGLNPIEFTSKKIINISNDYGHTDYLKKDNLKNLLRQKNVKRKTKLEFL